MGKTFVYGMGNLLTDGIAAFIKADKLEVFQNEDYREKLVFSRPVRF